MAQQVDRLWRPDSRDPGRNCQRRRQRLSGKARHVVRRALKQKLMMGSSQVAIHITLQDCSAKQTMTVARRVSEPTGAEAGSGLKGVKPMRCCDCDRDCFIFGARDLIQRRSKF